MKILNVARHANVSVRRGSPVAIALISCVVGCGDDAAVSFANDVSSVDLIDGAETNNELPDFDVAPDLTEVTDSTPDTNPSDVPADAPDVPQDVSDVDIREDSTPDADADAQDVDVADTEVPDADIADGDTADGDASETSDADTSDSGPDGSSSCVDLRDCELGELCIDSACVVPECTPGSIACFGDNVAFCNSRGELETQLCAEGTRCQDDSGIARCETIGCEIVGNGCLDNRTSFSCSALGAAPLLRNCAEDQYCEGGSCIDQLCTPGTAQCRGLLRAECNSLGSSETVTSCAISEECRGAAACACTAGECVALECIPNTTRCDGNSAVRCNSAGTAETVTPCGASALCIDGVCEATCVPGETRCSSGRVEVCSAARDFRLVTDCATLDRICVLNPDPVCVDACVPGAATCISGTQLESCQPDGFTLTRSTCGAGLQCVVDECVSPAICTPGETLCESSTLYECSTDGTEWVFVQNCGLFGCTFCDLLGGTCGDGVVDSGEDCDDGNSIDTDECHNDCVLSCNLQPSNNSTGVVYSGDTTGARDDYGNPCGTNAPDIAVSWYAPRAGTIDVELENASSSATLWVANGSCLGAQIGCDTDDSLFGNTPIVTFSVVTSGQYTFHVDGVTAGTTFDVRVTYR